MEEDCLGGKSMFAHLSISFFALKVRRSADSDVLCLNWLEDFSVSLKDPFC